MSDGLVSIQAERFDGWLLVRLDGEIDLSNAHQVYEQLESTIEGWSRVVIDLAELEYLDSQGLRLFKQLSNKLDEDDTVLEVVAPPDSFARQVLDMARMSDYMDIRDARDS